MLAKGQASAQYDPPQGVSPALARLLLQGVYDDRAFAAALASLAAKRRLSLNEIDGSWTLADAGEVATLSRGERALVKALFRGSRQCDMGRKNYLRFMHARESHYDAVTAEVKPGLLKTIGGWLSCLGTSSMTGRDINRIDHLHRYRTFLDIAVNERVDPRFAADGRFYEMPPEMPYIIAFGLHNSWGDRFTAAVSGVVEGQPKDTSLNSLYAEHRRKLARRQPPRIKQPSLITRPRGYGNGRHGQELWDTFEGPGRKW